jgi:hypothetical protein
MNIFFLEEKGKATAETKSLQDFTASYQFLGQCQTPHAAQGFLTVK